MCNVYNLGMIGTDHSRIYAFHRGFISGLTSKSRTSSKVALNDTAGI